MPSKPKRLKLASSHQANTPRVLFVDDEPSFTRAIIRFLPCQVEVTVVTDALRAIQELERRRFDLVVADQEMPGMWGLKLLQLVAARWPDMRRILLTGHTSADLIARAQPHADAVLDKILSPEILTEKICYLATNPRAVSSHAAK